MYCHQCGNELRREDKFCPGCGTKNAQSEQEQPEESSPIGEQPEETSSSDAQPEESSLTDAQPTESLKSHKWLWIIIVSAAVLVVTALIVFFIVFRNVAPLLTVGRALENLGNEVEERFENTPFKALVMLSDVLEDGTLTAKFEYKADMLGGFLGADIDGNAKLHSNTNTREFALEADINLYGEAVDLDIYMNRERLALRTGILGDRFYGITYNTFRDDIRAFGRRFFLDDETMDMLADIVDQINEIMNEEEAVDDDALEIYSEVFSDFIKNINVSAGRSHIESGGERLRCTEVLLTISKAAILELLNGLYDILENDEAVRAQYERYNNPLLEGVYGNIGDYEQALRDIKGLINDFERYYEGDILLWFAIGRDDRLLRFYINADITYDGEHSEIGATFDFGTSIEDSWVFDLSVNDSAGSNTFFIEWDYEVHSNNYRNTIHAEMEDLESITLISDFNEGTGDFTLTFISRWDMSNLTGVFTTDDENFRLLLENVLPDSSDNALKIDILAETGSKIDEISFINIDRWGYELVGVLLRFLFGGIIS